MSPDPQIVLSKIAGIEAEMRRIGLWQKKALRPEQYRFAQAFGMDRMTFTQWLQFIFIPRVREAAVTGNFPAESHVATQAMREFDGFSEASQLIKLLAEFDALY